MLGNQEWRNIRRYVDAVCNREGDDIVFSEGRVQRQPDGGVILSLSFRPDDVQRLEPLPENVDPHYFEDFQHQITHGVGRPD